MIVTFDAHAPKKKKKKKKHHTLARVLARACAGRL